MTTKTQIRILLPFDSDRTTVLVGYLEDRGQIFVDIDHDGQSHTWRMDGKRALDLADALYHAVDRHHARMEAHRDE